MFLIDQDPERFIPNIREDFIINRAILLYVKSTESTRAWVYTPIIENNKVVWFGAYINSQDDVHTWSSSRSESLISLLIWTYKYFAENEYDTSIMVIDKKKDLLNIINSITIKNSEVSYMLINLISRLKE